MNHVSALDERPGWRAPLAFAGIVLLGMGLLYSAAGASLGLAMFSHAATGSLIQHDGRAVGSALVAQPFADAKYFQPRPSAANYDPMAAAGSNHARSNPDMRSRVNDAIAAIATRDGIAPGEVPIELVTQSGGGMDPHVTPAGARVQIARIARARGLEPVVLEALVAEHIEGPQFGALGQSRVNVLKLNLALDRHGG